MTNYDKIADIYQETKQNPLPTYADEFTFLNALGDVNGKSVLDLACGYGHYSRLIKVQGAGSGYRGGYFPGVESNRPTLLSKQSLRRLNTGWGM